MTDLCPEKAATPDSTEPMATDIVADPGLSAIEKSEALRTLEQDARQLAVAANEGMIGGEETRLQEVLNAKQALDLTPTQHAYALVLQDIRTRQAASPPENMRALLDCATRILESLQRPMPADASGPETRPDSPAETEMEAQLEKLDP